MKIQLVVLAGTLLLSGPELARPLANLPCAPLPSSPARPALTRPAFTLARPTTAPPAGLHLALVNVLGSVVYEQTLPATAPLTVPAGRVPAGLYWVRLRGPRGYQLTQRLMLA